MMSGAKSRTAVLAGLIALASACSSSGSSTPPPPPEQPGPYAFAHYDTSFTDDHGDFASTVYYPASADGAPFPIVTFAPGTCSIKEWYTWFGEQLAGYGYIVLVFTPPAITAISLGACES